MYNCKLREMIKHGRQRWVNSDFLKAVEHMKRCHLRYTWAPERFLSSPFEVLAVNAKTHRAEMENITNAWRRFVADFLLCKCEE